VLYIITPDEKEVFLKLQTDTEREQFIVNFWARRDPDPDTEENEWREEYYTRIAYTNEHFSAGIPGWKTDRGKTYIMLGPPDKIEKGQGSFAELNEVPFEKWLYKNKSIALTFIDPTDSREFRFLEKENVLLLHINSPEEQLDCIDCIQ
jgi:GWxTD domain-containing protein